MGSAATAEARSVDDDGGISGAGRPHLARDVATVPLADLDPAGSLRLTLDRRHLATIVELDGRWPPILVDRATRRILDGHYRYRASEHAGRTHIVCEFFEGNDDEAFVEAVPRNSSHGLPLTLAERRRVAGRLLAAHRNWSDRCISRIAGLSASTVGTVRRTIEGEPGVSREPRLGGDGRLHTPDRGLVRERVRSALDAMPEGSLREVARLAGASPETVRAVRNGRAAPAISVRPNAHVAPDVVNDRALAAAPHGVAFATWFEQSTIEPAHIGLAEDIPLSRVYELADEARRRASLWSTFADAVEARIRGRRR